MKTKIFFLLAALLLSVSAFAQSESPLKGDVNNDGTVDVADINAIIEIMKNGGGTGEETKYYFSIGTNAVTASNYTTVNGATTTIPTTMEYTSSQRVRHYVLIPSNKTLTIIDKNAQVQIPMTEDTSISISNHKLYYTNGAIASGATVVITLSDGTGEETKYYFSIGTNAVTASNYTTVNNATTTIPTTTQTFVNNSGSKAAIYVLVPSSKTITMVDMSIGSQIPFEENTSISIANHKVYVTTGRIANGGGIIVTISDEAPASNYYYYAGWTLPTVDNVETIINETYPAESGSSVINTAGKKTTSKSTMDYTSNTLYNANAKVKYYVLVPTGQAIYDSLGNNVIASTFTSQGTITVGNQIHTIYAYNGTSRNIGAIIIR